MDIGPKNTDFQPTWALIKKPSGYPEYPSTGKIEMIWNTNKTSLYHRLSPYTDYDTTLLGKLVGDKEPFYYIYPDESNKGLSALRKYESQAFPLGSGPIDIIRVSKFLVSGRGIGFLAKQFLLQTGNPYNETRVYNPTSPIIAASNAVLLGAVRPQRFVDTSGGLSGIATSLLGSAGSAIMGAPKTDPPSGTTGLGALSDSMKSIGGKGLLRAGDANRAKSHLESSWVPPGKQNSTFGSVVKGMATSLFSNIIPAKQDGIQHRSDEGAYGLMLSAGSRFSYTGASGTEFTLGSIWIGGKGTNEINNVMRKNTEKPANQYHLYYLAGTPIPIKKSDIVSRFKISSDIYAGYDIAPNSSQDLHPGTRYGDNVGSNLPSNGPYENSDIMVNYNYYVNTPKSIIVPTKNISKFSYTGASGTTYNFGQLWMGGSKVKEGLYPEKANMIFVRYDKIGTKEYYQSPSTVETRWIPDMDYAEVGYRMLVAKTEHRYEDEVGSKVPKGGPYRNSDIMLQYKFYADQEQNFPTKNPDLTKDNLNNINTSLKNVIKNINSVGDNIYKFRFPVNIDDNGNETIKDNNIIRTGDFIYDYNRLAATKNKNDNRSGINYKLGALKAYRDSGVKMVDASLVDDPINNSVKLPTNGKYDAINVLTVLDENKALNYPNLLTWKTWNPYRDDLIALFFYDVVNKKYIPFRAAIKGLQEAGNASWEEMPFIGRADKVYSYGGFSRNLSFTIKIVISSIAELFPTWQRINYMCTAIKPANYTTAQMGSDNNAAPNRFMVPPMFMLTIGDMYKDQPVLIQSITPSIPEDAAWETMNIDNTSLFENNSQKWSYLANMISGIGVPYGLFGQLPREVELGFSMYLLEKERAVVGGANFGHAPRDENWEDNTNTVPNPGLFKPLHKSLVVNVIKNAPLPALPLTPAPTPRTQPQPQLLQQRSTSNILSVPLPTKNFENQGPNAQRLQSQFGTSTRSTF